MSLGKTIREGRMGPQDYGLVFVKGEFRYFADYEIIPDKGGSYLKVTLANGEHVFVYGYYSKTKDRWVEAIEAIHRYPTSGGG